MRLALLATASTLIVGFATLACTGSSSVDTGTADAGTTVETTTGSGSSTTTTTSTTAATDAGTVDAAVTTTTTDNDAGAACAADSIHETESNDTVANVIQPVASSSFCGRLTGTDVDKVSFTMPMTIASFAGGFDLPIGNGELDVAADVNGQPFNFFGRWPFVAGGTYTFTLSGSIPDGSELDYKMNFKFNQ